MAKNLKHPPTITKELYKKYYTLLCYKFKQYGMNATETHDYVQEAFVKVLSQLDKYDPEKAQLGTFIYRVATNYIIDLTRKRKTATHIKIDRSTTCDISEKRELLTDNRNMPDKNYEINENQTKAIILVGLINDLPDSIKLVLKYYIKNYRYKEIAKILNISVGNVKTKVFKAKTLLIQKYRNRIKEKKTILEYTHKDYDQLDTQLENLFRCDY